MTKPKPQDSPKILNKMIDGLAQASGGCSQLIHLMHDPRWVALRNGIDFAREGCINVATFQATKITVIK